jgi:hypothetical protein
MRASWSFIRGNTLAGEHVDLVPTVYDVANKAGLTTARVDWVAINRAPTITWGFNEWATASGPLEQEMIQKGVITASDLENFTK